MKFNIILHITTSCNFDCSYCDVIKDKKNMSLDLLNDIILFVKRNKNYIDSFKFFGGEPLLAKKDIFFLIDKLNYEDNYHIVTNTSLLTEDLSSIFNKRFKYIFFSIDSENYFDYDKVITFIKTSNIEYKVYFNLIVDPLNIHKAKKQFYKLYDLGMFGFNILPIYFTKKWSTNNLKEYSLFMKEVLDLSIKDKNIRLYGFQENKGYDTSLVNDSLFIDIDGNIYFSDIVSTFSGSNIKKDLFIGNIKTLNLSDFIYYDFKKEKKSISKLEEIIYNKIEGQYSLHKLMDYFSIYLNKKNEK